MRHGETALIYPSARAIGLAAAMAVPALVVALAVPSLWYAGLIGVIFVVALTLVDGLTTAPPTSVSAQLDLPAGVAVGATLRPFASTSVRGQQTRIEHDTRLRPEGDAFVAARRGRAVVDALWQRWPGRFGLTWRQRRVPLDRSIAILPDVAPARAEALRLFRRDASHGVTQQPEIGAGGEYHALAEFRTGMDHRAIDWKASARHGGLIAKEYRTERNNDLVFAVDCGRLMSEPVDGQPRVDRALSAALTAAFVALKLGDRARLFSFDAVPRIASAAVAGVGGFGQFQRIAADVDYSTAETNFTYALTTLGSTLKRRSLVMIFTDFVDPTSAETMLATVGRLTAKHLVLFVLMRDAELDALVDAEPLAADDVARAVVAAAMLRERRIVIARLQRLGAQIVEAPYDRLGSELVNAYLTIKRRNQL